MFSQGQLLVSCDWGGKNMVQGGRLYDYTAGCPTLWCYSYVLMLGYYTSSFLCLRAFPQQGFHHLHPHVAFPICSHVPPLIHWALRSKVWFRENGQRAVRRRGRANIPSLFLPDVHTKPNLALDLNGSDIALVVLSCLRSKTHQVCLPISE